MKFNIKDKEINVEPATLRQISELEKSIGNISTLGTEKPVESILKVLEVILAKPENAEVTMDWVLDNCSMSELESLGDVVTHFLGVSTTENTPE
jgi:hypothetical protein